MPMLIGRRRKSLLMSARNDFVTEGLQRNYSKKVPGGRLEVFCVSNTDYETFSANGNVDMVNASGIPALRRFCHTITAKAQYFEAKKFLHSTLPSLLTSTRLWVEKGRENDDVLDGKSKQEVFEGFGTMCKGIESAFEGTTDKFLQSLRDQLLALTENRNAYWEREAEQRSNKWNSVRTFLVSCHRFSHQLLTNLSGTRLNTTLGARTMAHIAPKNAVMSAGTPRSHGR